MGAQLMPWVPIDTPQGAPDPSAVDPTATFATDNPNIPHIGISTSGGGKWVEINPPPTQSIGPSNAPPIPTIVNDDPSKMASLGNLAIGSLPTDEMARVRFLAKQRFPNLSQNDAVDRYFYKDNRLAYRGDDGSSYYEDPTLSWPASMPAIAEDAKVAANNVGPAMPQAGSFLGGLTAIGEGPPGWLSGVPAAAGGASLFDMARQGLAHLFTGEEKPWSARAEQTGGAAVEGGVSQIGANGMARGVQGIKALTIPAYNVPDVSQRIANAKQFGISLTPAEETGNRTLINRQRLLQNTSGSDQVFDQFYRNRNDQVSGAVDRTLQSLDPGQAAAAGSVGPPPPAAPQYTSPRLGAQSGVEGAQAVVNDVRSGMAKAAAPYYQKSLAPGNMIPLRTLQDTLAPDEQTILQSVINNARGDQVLGPKLQGWQDNSMYVLDAAKKSIDPMIKAAQDAGDPYRASILQGLQRKLLGTMDTAFPDYAKARSIYTEGYPTRSFVENGPIGDIAGLQNNDVNQAGRILFGPTSSPEDVRAAKTAFQNAGKMDQWNALAGSYLRGIFNTVPDATAGTIPNIGTMYRKAVFGNPQKRAVIQATFDHNPQFLNNWNALMDTLDATGAATRSDSITAFAQQGQKQLEREGGGWGPRLMDAVEAWNIPSNVASYWRAINVGKYADRQAQLFTTPEGRETLAEMRKLGPKSAGAIIALSNFLTGAGVKAVGNAYAPYPDGPVGGR